MLSSYSTVCRLTFALSVKYLLLLVLLLVLYKLPSIREICIFMLVYAYENEVLKKNHYYYNTKQALNRTIDIVPIMQKFYLKAAL